MRPTASEDRPVRYMLLIHDDPAHSTEDRVPAYAALVQELRGSKELVGGDRLYGVETATSVRVRDGKVAITDGPFAETREHLGGYAILDVAHLDRALEVAARIPAAQTGVIEVRPIMDNPNEP